MLSVTHTRLSVVVIRPVQTWGKLGISMAFTGDLASMGLTLDYLIGQFHGTCLLNLCKHFMGVTYVYSLWWRFQLHTLFLLLLVYVRLLNKELIDFVLNVVISFLVNVTCSTLFTKVFDFWKKTSSLCHGMHNVTVEKWVLYTYIHKRFFWHKHVS